VALTAPLTPRYPLLSRLHAEEGVVTVRVTLQLDGRVTDARVETSSGFAALDRAALTAVRGAAWRVRQAPESQAAAVTNVIVRVPVAFRLEDERSEREDGR
jgi:protein TonB